MRIYPVGEQPMTPEEKEWLMDVYNDRCQSLRIVVPASFIFFMAVCFSRLGFVIQSVISENMGWNLDFPGPGTKMIISFFLCLLVCLARYQFGILPFKKDADAGTKYKLPFRVLGKKYYPVTRQNMVKLDGIERMIEVDDETFNGCKEGDKIFLFLALRSRYVFNKPDSFEA